jgi:hypothetical protein
MGYRSNVQYVIQFHKPEDYWGFIAESKLDPDTAECFCEEWTQDCFTQNDAELCIEFQADDVKWYESYEDVICHTNLWNKAEFRNVCDGFFVRYGESDDDTEQKSFGNQSNINWIF